MTYNGWTNYDTWNVALWFDNDSESLAEYVAEFARAWDTFGKYPPECIGGYCPYCGLVEDLQLEDEMTPDKVAWLSPNLNHEELYEWLWDKARDN